MRRMIKRLTRTSSSGDLDRSFQFGRINALAAALAALHARTEPRHWLISRIASMMAFMPTEHVGWRAVGRRDPRQRIEFEARSVLFDHRNMRALTALIALASVQPGREWRRCVGERLCAAGIGIGRPKVRIKVALWVLPRRAPGAWAGFSLSGRGIISADGHRG